MAGTVAVIEQSVKKVRDEWEICFARFIPYPPTCSSLSPSTPLSSSVPPPEPSYNSITSMFNNLNASFTQLIFLCQIQKFAMRFPSIYEAESFIGVLKEILKGDKDPEPLNTDFGSEISSQSEFMSTNEHSYSRGCEELSFMTPADNYIPQLPIFVNNEVGQPSGAEVKGTTPSHNFEGVLPALPPSFSSLLMDCSQNNLAQPTVSEEIELKSQIVRYMEDSSFQDMLIKVEKVISELGGDMSL
ncbi:hypothetical protein LR48_Vigan01g124500 [Vigna angularis]|uniref:Poor homologous synapsis 1 PH domain-containing protein n=1 Tax=Phaseolus angularis TaxID=3914 RepID=A0A0L9TMA4_PHAAN|nr:hypothetical protein LR48_Vigan01g124500 [Vigna angularis]